MCTFIAFLLLHGCMNGTKFLIFLVLSFFFLFSFCFVLFFVFLFFCFFSFSYLHSWIHKRDCKSSMKLLLKASPCSYKGASIRQ
jgi:hypothetical protein